MKMHLILSAVILSVILAGGIALAQQQGYGPQGQGWFCPWCGGQGQTQGYGMGPGMMYRGQDQAPGWYGQGMGPGMMYRSPETVPGWQDQRMGPGHMRGWQGSGHMQGRSGRGHGPGMMGDQWGRGQYGPYNVPQQMEPLSRTAARELAQNYVAGNPNLKLGEIVEQEDAYVASIVTQDDSLVEKLLIDKNSGWMKKEY